MGRRVGRSRVAISNLIRLLELPEDVLDLIEGAQLSEGHGRALLMCKDQTCRRRLAMEARDAGWSVRETEQRAREAEGGSPRGGQGWWSTRTSRRRWPRAEDALSAVLGQDVKARAKVMTAWSRSRSTAPPRRSRWRSACSRRTPARWPDQGSGPTLESPSMGD